MGASLGHLVVYNYNVSTTEYVCMTQSIDFGVTTQEQKTKNTYPLSKVLEDSQDLKKGVGWNESHLIVQICMIPSVSNPVGWVLPDYDKEKYDVGMVLFVNELELGYVVNEFSVLDKTSNMTTNYKHADFTYIGPDEECDDDHNHDNCCDHNHDNENKKTSEYDSESGSNTESSETESSGTESSNTELSNTKPYNNSQSRNNDTIDV